MGSANSLKSKITGRQEYSDLDVQVVFQYNMKKISRGWSKELSGMYERTMALLTRELEKNPRSICTLVMKGDVSKDWQVCPCLLSLIDTNRFCNAYLDQ